MPFCQRGEVHTYYEVVGEGEPLVLLCGISGSSEWYWQGVLSSLAKEYRVVMIDPRGSGKTVWSGSDFTISDLARDVESVIDHLQLEGVAVFGQSMGSLVAAEIARKTPVKKLILCNTFFAMEKGPKMAFEMAIKFINDGVSIKDVMWNMAPWIFSSDFLMDEKKEKQLKRFYEEIELSIFGFTKQFAAVKEFNSHPWIQEIRAKTLVIGAERDILTPPRQGEEVARHMRDAQFALISGGHAPHVEKPSHLVKLILNFLA